MNASEASTILSHFFVSYLWNNPFNMYFLSDYNYRKLTQKIWGSTLWYPLLLDLLPSKAEMIWKKHIADIKHKSAYKIGMCTCLWSHCSFYIKCQNWLFYRQILQLKLEIIRANPESVHLLFEGKAGLAASIRGDVIQVMKCQRVEKDRIKPRGGFNQCYADFPIFFDDKPKFLSKRNGIIVDSSSIVKCQEESPIHLVTYTE